MTIALALEHKHRSTNSDGPLRIKSEIQIWIGISDDEFRQQRGAEQSSTFVTFMMSVDLTTVSVDSVIVASGRSMLNGGDCVPFTVTESER